MFKSISRKIIERKPQTHGPFVGDTGSNTTVRMSLLIFFPKCEAVKRSSILAWGEGGRLNLKLNPTKGRMSFMDLPSTSR
jgi:hypothetical protein